MNALIEFPNTRDEGAFYNNGYRDGWDAAIEYLTDIAEGSGDIDVFGIDNTGIYLSQVRLLAALNNVLGRPR